MDGDSVNSPLCGGVKSACVRVGGSFCVFEFSNLFLSSSATKMAVSASRWRRTRPWKSALLVHRTIFVLSLLLLTSEGYLATHFSASRPHSTQFCHVATSTHHDASIVEQNTWEGAAVGLYVHIPYCRRRCRYCDFAIVPIGNSALTDETNESEQQHSIEEPSSAIRATRGFLDMDAAYRTAVLKEIDTIQTRFNGTKIPLQSIYFGGGTPSLAPVATLEAILSTILDENSPFLLEKDAEVSIEMDPGTFSRYKLNVIKNMGFNRVSLGVQSFNDNVLESIGRCHRQADIYESISLLQQVYGEDVNYSMDLISGLPGVSLALWAETLEIATNLVPRPNHLSLYDLQVESGTVFGKWYDDAGNDSDRTRGSAPVNVPGLPSPDDCAFAYKYASSYLRAKGYEHYEISSYAFRGDEQEVPLPYRSRHNQIYWQSGSQWFGK